MPHPVISYLPIDEYAAQLHSGVEWIQFPSLPPDGFLVQLAELLQSYPDVMLRVYGSYDGSIRNLDFLAHFPTLRRFCVDAIWDLEDISGLRYLPTDVLELSLGRTRRQQPLEILARFESLVRLYLEGQTKRIDVLSDLTALEHLILRSVTLPSLELLRPLENLAALELKLGGTSDLSLLPSIGRLQYVELWMVKGLVDLRPISQLPSLRYLFLQALRRVEELPDFSSNTELRRVHVESMKGLTSIEPLRSARSLRELEVIDMPQLTSADFQCLVGHPTLEKASVGLGSIKRNDAVTALLGLPTPDRGVDWRTV